MNDREFLMWLHARLTDVHGESSLIDYMHKFRAVIYSIPENQVTPNDGRGGNDLASLREKCAQQSVQADLTDLICYNGNHESKDGICVVDGGLKPSSRWLRKPFGGFLASREKGK